MKKRKTFTNIFKTVLMFALVICMVCSCYIPVSADLAPDEVEQPESSEQTEQPEETKQPESTERPKTAEPLSANDTFIYVDVYTVEYVKGYNGDFFLRNNTLYIEKETLLTMAPLTEYRNQFGETIGFARTDVENAEFKVESDDYFIIKDRSYYPFIEAMSDLCINTSFNRKKEALIAIPAKSVWDIYSAVEPMYDNSTYKMWYWQTADTYDSETSRVLAQATDIGRKLYALPAAIYDYASGNATYDQYRAALQKITYPELDVEVSELQVYKNELKALTGIEYRGDLTKIEPDTDTESGYKAEFYEDHSASAKIASLVGKTDKLLQVEDSVKIMEYYANLENLNESIVHGLELVNQTGSIDINSLKEAMNDIVEINAGEKSMWNTLLNQTAEGLLEVIIGDFTDAATQAAGDKGIKGTAAEFWVNVMDYCGEKFLGQNYTTFQVESVIAATSNLHIQDAARRSFYYYKVIYETTENVQKKMEALENMRDTTLIYMLAGHNAWKAMEFDSDLAAGAKPTVEEMAEHIAYLLQYNQTDFSVYENAQDSKYAISALGDWRDQYIYLFNWDEEKGNAVGGLDFSIEGKDEEGLGFLYKKIFTYVYYQQNGMLVGNIRTNSRTDKYTRTVEILETEGVCEIVIRPKNKGASVADVGITAYTGTRAKEWTKGLDTYLVTEADGTVIYRIPVPFGSGASKGEALPSTRVDSKFDFTVPISGRNDTTAEENTDVFEVVETTYVPTGPFNGEYSFETNVAKYTIKYNDNIFGIATTAYLSTPYIAYKEDLEDIISKNVCQLSVVDWDFNRYYQGQKNLYDDSFFRVDYPIEDVKEIRLENGTVKYFAFTSEDSDMIDGTVYCFYADFGDGMTIIGSWGEKENEGRAIEVFEHFILEIFGQMKIEYYN